MSVSTGQINVTGHYVLTNCEFAEAKAANYYYKYTSTTTTPMTPGYIEDVIKTFFKKKELNGLHIYKTFPRQQFLERVYYIFSSSGHTVRVNRGVTLAPAMPSR